MLFWILLACGGPQTARTEVLRATDTLVVAVDSAPRTALSAFATTNSENLLSDALQIPLLDSSFSCGLQHGVGAVQSWSFSEDGRQITMELRPDLAWEDGTPLTAADVVAGQEVLGHKELKALGPRQLQWTGAAEERGRMLARVAGLTALPKHLLNETLTDALLRKQAIAMQHPVSYGPWQLSDWAADSVSLVPNPHAPYDWQPHFNKLIFRTIPDADDRVIALERGDVDVVQGLRVKDINRLQVQKLPIILRHQGWRGLNFVPWNLQSGNPALANPQVRRALAYATGVERMLADMQTTAKKERLGRPAVGTLSPSLCRSHADEIVRLSQDVDQARKLLTDAGWTDNNADGWLDQGGQILRLRLIGRSNQPQQEEIAKDLTEDFAKIGVQLEVELLDAEAFAVRLSAKDWDAALLSWTAGLTPELAPSWGSHGAWNFGGYQNPAVDALLAQEAQTADQEAAIGLRHQIQSMVYTDQPALFLFWTDSVSAVQRRIEEAEVDMLSPLSHLHRWTVPEDEWLRDPQGIADQKEKP